MPKDKDRRKEKPKGKLQRRARRDVALSQQDLIDQLERSMGATQSAYGGYQDLLAGMAGQYQEQTGDISQDLMNQYSQLASMLGGNAPATEAGAANELFGGAGAGALGILSSDTQRNLDYQASAKREGGLASRYAQDNLIQQMNDLYAQRPQLIRQRTDELRDQSLERQLAKSQISSDESFNQFLQSQIGGLLSGGGNRQNRNNLPQGNGGFGGGGNTLPPTDTSVGGNNFSTPGQQFLRPEIDQFGELPPWLQDLVTGTRQPETYGPRRRRIWRNVRRPLANRFPATEWGDVITGA